PNHQGQQLARNLPAPDNQAQVTTLFTSDEPTCVHRIQIWSYEGEDPIDLPHEFITMGPQGHHMIMILREEINRQLELIKLPAQGQQAPAALGTQYPILITLEVLAPPSYQTSHLSPVRPPTQAPQASVTPSGPSPALIFPKASTPSVP